ncbi:VWFA domain-containing protein [Aphelenchoides besseyi]|nr:VWFA domain-containing protein [Aphelenchoides besseyi]KAI6218960.1 VWFA domain-containing protein [Aphelenchoides besseyi]
MTIIVFLVDTSVSMAQKSYVGISYLDFARQFVDIFIKMRQRDPISTTDRYMLMAYDDYPKNVKSGWKERQPQFNEQLRNLRPTGTMSFAEAFFNAIRFVNLNRVQTGIDNYGYGRFPSYSEPVIFIAIVDATCESPRNQFYKDGKFPPLNAPGSELTDEPYRWDHKLFVVFVDLTGHAPFSRAVVERVATVERQQVESIVERLNGRIFNADSPRTMSTIIEGILQRMQQNGVFVRFTRYLMPHLQQNGSNANGVPNWNNQVALINRIGKPGSHSIWPIPEAFYPDLQSMILPPRRVYPEIAVKCDKNEPTTLNNIQYDEYYVDPCPMTEAIVNEQNPNNCWQLFVNHSSKNRMGYPFGYLKLSEDLKTVKMHVLPYNYPLLYLILEESRDEHSKKLDNSRMSVNVAKYFTNLPPYYIQPLRKTLKNQQIPHAPMLDNSPAMYNNTVLMQMKKWKELGKEEYETICQQVANYINPNHQDAIKTFPIVCGSIQLPMIPITSQPPSQMISVPTKVGLLRKYQPIKQHFKIPSIAITKTRTNNLPSSKFRNPYDIKKSEIVDHLERMVNNLDAVFAKRSITQLEGGPPGKRMRLQHAEDIHQLPVGKMGDYQDYLKRMAENGRAPLRELEPQVSRPHAFGNPFKYDKKSMTVDEVKEEIKEESPEVEPNVPRQSADQKRPGGKHPFTWPRRRRSYTQ